LRVVEWNRNVTPDALTLAPEEGSDGHAEECVRASYRAPLAPYGRLHTHRGQPPHHSKPAHTPHPDPRPARSGAASSQTVKLMRNATKHFNRGEKSLVQLEKERACWEQTFQWWSSGVELKMRACSELKLSLKSSEQGDHRKSRLPS